MPYLIENLKDLLNLDAGRELLTRLIDFVYDRVAELRAQKAGPDLYTYIVGLAPDKDAYAPGEEGEATFAAERDGEAIDFVVSAPPASFVLTSLRCGDENDDMLFGTRVSADVFGAAVMNRFVRFTKFKRGDVLRCKFRRNDGGGNAPFAACFKLRSPALAKAAQEVAS